MANSDNCFRLDQAIRKQVPLPLAQGQVRLSRTLFTVAMALLQRGELVQQLPAVRISAHRDRPFRYNVTDHFANNVTDFPPVPKQPVTPLPK